MREKIAEGYNQAVFEDLDPTVVDALHAGQQTVRLVDELAQLLLKEPKAPESTVREGT